jgi:hypothetical protein
VRVHVGETGGKGQWRDLADWPPPDTIALICTGAFPYRPEWAQLIAALEATLRMHRPSAGGGSTSGQVDKVRNSRSSRASQRMDRQKGLPLREFG